MTQTQLEFYLADLSDEGYEKLIIQICKILFGEATYGFVKGRDAGKDAVFRGTASNFPNAVHPWSGIIVIQAKHTSFAKVLISQDSKFFNPDSKSAILTKEVEKIAALRTQGELTHYFLATNRVLTGGIDNRIIEFLAEKSGLDVVQIHIYDVKQTIDFLEEHPEVLRLIQGSEEVLRFNAADLRDVINAFVTNSSKIEGVMFPEFNRIEYKKKNEINGISPEFAESFAKWNLKYTNQIHIFLSDPRNEELAIKYNLVAQQIDLQLASLKGTKKDFEQLLMYACDEIVESHPVFRKFPQLTRALVFYMYFSCDVGTRIGAINDLDS